MKIKRFIALWFMASLLAFACSSKDGGNNNNNGGNGEEQEDVYKNPVINISLPDPTLIKAADGYFYLYATEDIRNIPIYKSKDLVEWSYVTTAFREHTRPDFEPNGGLWAPNVEVVNGRYHLYYSMSVWGGEMTCGIGVAVSDKPEGPFEDQGKMFRSAEIGVQNSIDPCYVEIEGQKYMFWGSFRGIYAIQLDDDGLKVAENAEKIHIAGTAFEGVHIHKHKDYYYLFASIGSCCQGANSTYELVVGRSSSPFGPYVNKSGKEMLDNGFEHVIRSGKRFVGNGHCSQLVKDDEGSDWILYHGIDVTDPDERKLMLDKVEWDQKDWPYIKNGTPSLQAEPPIFK